MKIESLESVHAGYINTPLEPMPRLAAALANSWTQTPSMRRWGWPAASISSATI